VVASDVDNPLTGLRGAAAVFGPQKGAGPADVEELEQALSQLVGLLQAPISKFVRTLAEPHAKLVRTIAAVKDQKAAASG